VAHVTFVDSLTVSVSSALILCIFSSPQSFTQCITYTQTKTLRGRQDTLAQVYFYWGQSPASPPRDLRHCPAVQRPPLQLIYIYQALHCASLLRLVVGYTHTHLTALCPGLPRSAGARKVKPIWILLKQETVSGSGISWAICKSAHRSRQIITPAPHHSVFTGRMLFLPPNQQCQSTEGISSRICCFYVVLCRQSRS